MGGALKRLLLLWIWPSRLNTPGLLLIIYTDLGSIRERQRLWADFSHWNWHRTIDSVNFLRIGLHHRQFLRK